MQIIPLRNKSAPLPPAIVAVVQDVADELLQCRSLPDQHLRRKEVNHEHQRFED